MKTRTFYPRQVLRKLQGVHTSLDAGQEAALKFVLRRGRKLGYSVSVFPTTTAAQLAGTTSREAADMLLSSAPTRITLQPSV